MVGIEFILFLILDDAIFEVCDMFWSKYHRAVVQNYPFQPYILTALLIKAGLGGRG